MPHLQQRQARPPDHYGGKYPETRRPMKNREIQWRLSYAAWRHFPMLGIGPGGQLKELMQRLSGDVKEVIIATNSLFEGETTAMYISRSLIKPTE